MKIIGRTYLDFADLEPNTWYEIRIRKQHSAVTAQSLVVTDANGNIVVAQFTDIHIWDQCNICGGAKVIQLPSGTVACPQCANCKTCGGAREIQVNETEMRMCTECRPLPKISLQCAADYHSCVGCECRCHVPE